MMGTSIPYKSQRGVRDALKTGCGIGDEKLPTVTLRGPEGKQAPEGKKDPVGSIGSIHGKEPFDVAPSL